MRNAIVAASFVFACQGDRQETQPLAPQPEVAAESGEVTITPPDQSAETCVVIEPLPLEKETKQRITEALNCAQDSHPRFFFEGGDCPEIEPRQNDGGSISKELEGESHGDGVTELYSATTTLTRTGTDATSLRYSATGVCFTVTN